MDRVVELLNHAGEAACAVDREQRLTFLNEAACGLFGFQAAEAIGRHCYDVFRGADPSACLLCREGCEIHRLAADSRPIQACDMQMRRKNGSQLWVNVSTLQIPSRWHELAVLIHLIRDITPSKSVEMDLRKLLDRLEESNCAHGRTPAPSTASTKRHSSLTTRERDVLRQVATGLPTAAVASTLCISEATVRNHLHNILSKLGAHSRLEAVAVALRDGLI